MRKIFYILALLMVLAVNANAQTAVSEQEKAALIAKINKQVAAMNTMQCDFVQKKKLSLLKDVAVSKGKMLYKQGGKLRWEYTSPTSYVFVLNDNKVTIKAPDSKTSTIDVKKNKVFQEVTRLMMSSITGKCLTDAKTFGVKIFSKDGLYYAELTPQKKEMKQMMSTIRLHFNKAQTMVTKVEMVERKGDVTTIELLNAVTNKPIGDERFVVK